MEIEDSEENQSRVRLHNYSNVEIENTAYEKNGPSQCVMEIEDSKEN